ncbi:LAFA_0E16314g1_1 [Lachancea sp. 'fantastica']|nr:LAFA_0E16314g1_1 [Lachancea sp. 'fantastica']
MPCSQSSETNTNCTISSSARHEISLPTAISSGFSDYATTDVASITSANPSPPRSISQEIAGVTRMAPNKVPKNHSDFESHVEGFFASGQPGSDIHAINQAPILSSFPQLPHPKLPSEQWTIASNSLSISEQKQYLQLFWNYCHSLLQIMSKGEFDELGKLVLSTTDDDYSVQHALIDAMIALGLQHSHTTELSGRILGLSPLSSEEMLWPGFGYFSRSCERMRASTEVTINALRCHVLLALYLMKGNAFHDAYNLFGITVRKAYIAKFHRIPSSHLAEAERTARVQLWWVLFSLDLCCSLQLDMPAACQKNLVKCSLPSEDALIRYHGRHNSANSYTIHLANLCVIIADIGDGGSTADLVDDGDDDNSRSSKHLEDHALLLSSALKKLELWRNGLPEELRWHPDGSYVDTAGSSGFEYSEHSHVSVRRQAILLELQYHNTYLLLQRPFIRLRNIASNDSHAIESHISSSLQHATKIVNTIYTVCSTSDLLYGWSEILQPLWNAALTIMAYIYANSLSTVVPEALDSLSRAQKLFELLSSTSSTAASAKETIGSLVSNLQAMMADVSSVVAPVDAMSWDLFASLMDNGKKSSEDIENFGNRQ